jgi:hypothetical protein
MAVLPSNRRHHDILRVNAHPRITVMTPAPHPDGLRTANRPDIGHHMRSFGAHFNPASVGSATAGVWSSATLSASIAARTLQRQMLDLSPAPISTTPSSIIASLRKVSWNLAV